MSRIGIFLYGVISYSLSLVVFVYAFGFIGGFLAPTLLDGVPRRPLTEALTIDVALLLVFSIQHSGMARPAFKRWWTRIIPEAAERSTYVLVSSLLFVAFFVYWEPIGGVIWSVQDGAARAAVIGIYSFGWALLLFTTFLIDHFDLFGLTQVWRRLTNKSYRAPQFHTPLLYKLVRHPLYIGWFTIIWAAPMMTSAHLVFALITTAYILIAIQFEERDLVGAFGDRYVEYKARTPMIIPRLWPARSVGAAKQARS